MDAAAAKQQLRAAALAARGAMSDADRMAAGIAVARHCLDQWQGAGQVAAFVSFGTEPPTQPLLDGLAASGAQIVVPIVTGDDLRWVSYEATGPELDVATLATVDVILVPALAVDRHGNRLGRGRGYYDRALAGAGAPAVAVVYDDELLDRVPVEAHDRRVQGVLRPAGYSPL